MIEPFDEEWARQKLDMPRRRRELEAYIDRWLPELRTMEPGLVIDVGCGPCDFLELCREMGHEVVGVDAASGDCGMGDAYLDLCEAECRKRNVTVCREGWHWFSDRGNYDGTVAVLNFRGSIEQCYAHLMVGPSHSLHHDCRELDWDTDHAIKLPARRPILSDVFVVADLWLRNGGLLMIRANGTKSTDGWYDKTMRRLALLFKFELIDQDGLLAHKWRKP